MNCDDILAGRFGATAACQASPTTEDDSGEIVDTVSRVSGLRVIFDYEVDGAR